MGSIREKIKRFFLGKVSVKSLPVFMSGRSSLGVYSCSRRVPVSSLQTKVTVAKARFATWKKEVAKGHKFDLFISPPKAKGFSLSLDFRSKVSGGSVDSVKVKAHGDLKRVSALPQKRPNLSAYISDKKRKKEVLALFYPLIKECVVKSALEKESGALYVWYNPSCYGSPRVLCLVPDPGKRPPLAWKWL